MFPHYQMSISVIKTKKELLKLVAEDQQIEISKEKWETLRWDIHHTSIQVIFINLKVLRMVNWWEIIHSMEEKD